MRREWFLIPLLFPTMAVGPCNSQPLGDVRNKGPGCVYDGGRYAGGDQFRAIDRCNLCTCQTDGQVACTLNACAADAGGGDGGGTVGGVTVCGSGASTDGTPGWTIEGGPACTFGAIALLARTPGAAPCIITAAGVDSRNPSWSP